MRSQHVWTPWVLTLHSMIALVAIFQLAVIGLRHYWHAMPHGFMIAHKWVGVVALVIVLLYLLTKLKQQRLAEIFPWGRQGVAAIGMDIKTLLTLKLPHRASGGLPGLVQGFGILLILAMALSGSVCWILFQFADLQHFASQLFQVHKVLGTLVWWFVGGHAMMAILHRLLPHRYHQAKV